MTGFDDVEPHLGFAIGLLSQQVSTLVQNFLTDDELAEREAEQFLADARKKFSKGQVEHNDAWADWTDERFVQECRDEILDAVIYLAMMRSKQNQKGT